MSKKVIAVVGMPGSGKGTCTDYLAEKYGWPVVHFGNMVYEEVQRRGLHNVKDEAFVREDMRKVEGKAVLAKHVARKAHAHHKEAKDVVVLDGLYSWSEYKHLAKEFSDDLVVIAVAAPKKLRRQRVLDRKDSHRKYTLGQLITREIAEIENLEKGGPIAYADYTIVNDETPEKLLEKLEKILQETTLTQPKEPQKQP
jgi:dephospho-CoA kinase